MYEIKPILNRSFNFNLPKCVYKMKSIHKMSEINTENVSEQNYDSLNDLEFRQSKVLQQLRILQNQLKNLKINMNLNSRVISETNNLSESQSKAQLKNLSTFPNEVIINVNPNCIPYELLALKNIWEKLIDVNILIYSHSSINNLSPEAKEFEKALKLSKKIHQKPHMNIILIWNNSDNTKLITPSTTLNPIFSEINILRYFMRLNSIDKYNEDNKITTEVDSILDILFQLSFCHENKLRTQLMGSLCEHLESLKCSENDIYHILYIAIYSTLKRFNFN